MVHESEASRTRRLIAGIVVLALVIGGLQMVLGAGDAKATHLRSAQLSWLVATNGRCRPRTFRVDRRAAVVV